MKNAKLLTLLLLALIFNLSSCNNDEDEPTPISAKTEFLTTGEWKISKLDFNGVDVSDENKYPDVADVKSTRIDFNKDGTYTQTRTSGTETGTWKFTDNETHLLFGPNPAELHDWELVELNDSSFIGNTTFTYEDGPLDVRVELVHP
ncbi:DUF5004 domain-containing protein [Pontibacter sp. 172403-2]|uniref:DUF5004 domain-containing protein n=1 Tax=Pontibacter rufus TaxID=2791028 RepID=UPI0018AF5F67|nr:DUF5004 domain-containing protein [Pontibacter sp. 172403-2]MBF9252726.1 DUF5004 domain-containing protein [Pontibacter sp. 172403-2]